MFFFNTLNLLPIVFRFNFLLLYVLYYQLSLFWTMTNLQNKFNKNGHFCEIYKIVMLSIFHSPIHPLLTLALYGELAECLIDPACLM